MSGPDPKASARFPLGKELQLFQDALEQLLAPDLGSLRHGTREIVDWILEAYLSVSPQEKTWAYQEARRVAQVAAARLAGSTVAAAGLTPGRQERLRRDLERLIAALDLILGIIAQARGERPES